MEETSLVGELLQGFPCQVQISVLARGVWCKDIARSYYQFKQCLIRLPDHDHSAGIPGYAVILVCSGEVQWIYLHITETKNFVQSVSSLAFLWTKIIGMVSGGKQE